MNVMSLAQAPLGVVCIVKGIETYGPMRARLTDLGLVDGTRVTPLFKSLGTGLRAYNIRGAVIALRDVDAGAINVIPR